jgi:hypothetical protein
MREIEIPSQLVAQGDLADLDAAMPLVKCLGLREKNCPRVGS